MCILSKVEPREYTDSAMADKIKEYLEADKDIRKTIYGFVAFPRGTFLFNPTKVELFMDWYLYDDKLFMSCLRRAVMEIIQSVASTQWEKLRPILQDLKIKISDSKKVTMQELGPKFENTPVAFEAVVIADGVEKTYTKRAPAYCPNCMHVAELAINFYTHQIEEPPRCMNEECARYKQQMAILEREMVNGVFKIMTIQEPMEEASHGAPITYKCEIRDEDIRMTFLGQRKKIIGAFTSYVDARQATHDILIKVQAIHDVEAKDIAIATPSDINEFEQWVKDKDFLTRLCDSFAPEIYQEHLAKTAVIIAIAGGNKIGRLRGDIHALLIGDPATGKSKILEFIVFIMEKTRYVNGATASGAGITIAYDDKIKAPRIGAIPLCSGGLVAIDEIARLRKEDLDKTLESMESGTIHYDKAGWTLDVNALTTIVGGANPKNDYYDIVLSVVENINLPGPLISRFDLIVNMLIEKSTPRTINRLVHIDEFRDIGEDEFIKKNNLFTKEKLIKYFTYIRKLEPKMSKEASVVRQEFFTDILELQQKTGSLPIDNRFYEGLYRMATALAKLELSEIVTMNHMGKAIQIQKQALQTFGMDTGKGETQLNLQEEATSRNGAFLHSFHECMAKVQGEFVEDDAVVKDMAERYPDKFGNVEVAWIYFEEMHDNKLITKYKGRYKLSIG